MVSLEGKKLLRNLISHTGAHNRRIEEQDMWQQYEQMKTKRQSESHRPKYRAHMDEYHGDDVSRAAAPSGGHWMRKLQEFEEGDPDRWGHGGFKELYPEEFGSSSEEKKTSRTRKKKWGHDGFREMCPSETESTSSSEEEDEKRSKEKKRRKKKKKKEHKKSKKEKMHSKRKKKTKRYAVSSETEESPESDNEHKTKKRYSSRRSWSDGSECGATSKNGLHHESNSGKQFSSDFDSDMEDSKSRSRKRGHESRHKLHDKSHKRTKIKDETLKNNTEETKCDKRKKKKSKHKK